METRAEKLTRLMQLEKELQDHRNVYSRLYATDGSKIELEVTWSVIQDCAAEYSDLEQELRNDQEPAGPRLD